MCTKIMPGNETTKYSDKEKLNIFFFAIYITNTYMNTSEKKIVFYDYFLIERILV